MVWPSDPRDPRYYEKKAERLEKENTALTSKLGQARGRVLYLERRMGRVNQLLTLALSLLYKGEAKGATSPSRSSSSSRQSCP